METVAVLGASGFVGTTVVEHLLATGRYQIRPFINSGKNAWRLARLGLELQRADVLDSEDLVHALNGCSYVVNSIMGPRKVMFEGLKNVLNASRSVGVKRFVHLSSITAYGEPPPPESVHEDAPTRPQRGTYGWIKMTQDKIVLKAAEKDLSCAILCPPVVSGPGSTQLMWLLKQINEHRFALIGEGHNPCAVVDVDNLAHAVLLALEAEEVDGRRIFILDDEVPTWQRLLDEIEPLFNASVSIPRVSRTEVEQLMKAKTRLSPVQTLKHLMSPAARKVLCEDPLIRMVGHTAKQVLPASALQAIRKNGKGATKGVQPLRAPTPSYDPLQMARQLRGVYHSGKRAEDTLGYTPLYTFAESMARFRDWYMSEKGWTSSHADLVKHLEQ